MKVEITGRHVDITPAIRSYLMKRLRKFARILGDGASFHVILEVEKQRHMAEILLKSKYLDLAGKGQTGDLYTSILQAVEKIERQSLRQKGKIIEAKRQRTQEGGVAARSVSPARPRRPSAARVSSLVEEELPLKPMYLDEAALELQQSEYPFVMFRNAEGGGIQVLYRRNDGALGLIYA